MSLHIPLSILVQTTKGVYRLTKDARDLSYGNASPGGFTTCTVPLNRPLHYVPNEWQYYSRLWVVDNQHGGIVWDGYMEDPARSAGSDGSVWELTAIGPSSMLQDNTDPFIAVDQSTERWVRRPGTAIYMETNTNNEDEAAPGWRLRWVRGQVVPIGTWGGIQYPALRDIGQKLALIHHNYVMGVSDANHRMKGYAYSAAGNELIYDIAWTTAFDLSRVVVTDFANGRDMPHIAIGRTTSQVTITDDVSWELVSNITIRAMLYNADGTEKTTGYLNNNWTYAHELIADALGRRLNLFDGANATVATTTHQITQACWPEGISTLDMFTDLLTLEIAYTYHAWEQNSTGKHIFEFVPWPTEVRYEATVDDGYSSTGGGAGLFNRVNVRWRDPVGASRLTIVTQTVPELTTANRTRSQTLDLGDEIGSSTNAQRAGEEFLSEHLTPPNAGRLTIRRPIRDLLTGRTIQPWEIRSGNLIRVRGLVPRADALNTNTRDGLTVFRIVNMTYNADSNAAEVELDVYARNVVRQIADLSRRRILRRR